MLFERLQKQSYNSHSLISNNSTPIHQKQEQERRIRLFMSNLTLTKYADIENPFTKVLQSTTNVKLKSVNSIVKVKV